MGTQDSASLSYRLLVRDGELFVELFSTGETLTYAEWRALRDFHRSCCERCPYSMRSSPSPDYSRKKFAAWTRRNSVEQ